MDTRMIDVAIGLGLVFALTSLFVTALQEVFSSMSKMRGRVLQQALASFLGDDREFAQAIMDHPLLVSLSAETQAQRNERRPSYMDASSVVTALLAHLADTHFADGRRPSTPLEMVDAVSAALRGAGVAPRSAQMANAELRRPNDQFVRGLRSLLSGVESDWPGYEKRLVAWYDSVGDRSTGWFKRKTQAGVFVIGLLAAGVLNIDPLHIAQRLWNDEPLRKAVVAAGERISASHAAASGVQRSAPPAGSTEPAASGRADEAVVKTHQQLDAAVAAAMHRGGAETVLLAVAQAMVPFEQGLDAWKKAGGKSGQPELAKLLTLAQGLAATAPKDAQLASVRATLQALVETTQRAAASMAPAAAVPAAPGASAPRHYAQCGRAQPAGSPLADLCEQLDEFASLQAAGLPLGWPHGNLEFKPGEAAFWGAAGLMVLGWLVTAMACTLGAPFWFDSLSRLVRLRGAGASSAAPATDRAPSTMLSRTEAPAVSAVAASTHLSAMSDALNDAEQRLTVAEVQRVQRGLPMPETEVSGFFDGNTRRAIRVWQEAHQLLPATGELSEAQIRELLAMRTVATAPAAAMSSAASTAAPATPEHEHDGEDADGCDVPIINVTDDVDLPAARGGIEGG